MAGLGKPRIRKTFGTKIKDQSITNNQLYTLSASNQVIQTTSGIVGSGSVNNSMVATDPSGGTGTAKLQTMGDTMVGPIAFFAAEATISGGGDDPPYEIDISQSTGAYSSFVRVTGTGELRWISGTAFTGQLLFLQAVDGFTIYHQTGNIYIPSGENYAVAQDEIVMLLFDVQMTGQDYVLLTTGSGISLSGVNTWAGANTFSTYVQMNQSSGSNQAWGATSGGYFNVKDSAGVIRRVPYLI